ncbi:SRPBCC domain-containing protein [Nocardia altamirensis]|uniref:SRPBCC domain-containing protein n=1 Tax=Nocardia altamirensis TaxID=472158 RepID=UPI00083FE285|nr:SRPBCC domain-containing protein [Nocardia altamirensis]
MTDFGSLGMTEDGRWAVRFERVIAHPQAKVWRSLTETDQLRHWFVDMLDYDRTQFSVEPGAQLVFVAKAGGAPTFGKVSEVEPPRLLEYSWGDEVLRWELEPLGDEACRLVFVNVFADRDAAPGLGAGWHVGLDRLESHLAGVSGVEAAWDRLTGHYAQAFA